MTKAGLRRAPMPPGFKPYGTCCWCALPILYPAGHKRAGEPHLRRNWHTACVDWCYVANRSAAQRGAVWDRDQGRCALCGVQHPRTRVAGFRPYGTKERPQQNRTSWARQFDGFYMRAADWVIYTPVESFVLSDWEADHIVPLWSLPADLPLAERGCFFGVANLWTLCRICHSGKTSREAKARGLRRRETQLRTGLLIE